MRASAPDRSGGGRRITEAVRSFAAFAFMAALALSAATVAANGAAGHSSADHVSASRFVRSCDTAVYGDLGPVRRRQRHSIVVGPLAFDGIRYARTAKPGNIRRAYRAGQGAFKVLVVIKQGHAATVTVLPGERRHVALLYDEAAFNRTQTVAHGEQAVVFRACPSSVGAQSRAWSAATQFNGGIIVDSPRCVRLAIRFSGRPTRTIAAPLGPVSCR